MVNTPEQRKLIPGAAVASVLYVGFRLDVHYFRGEWGGGGLSLVVECLYVGFRFDVHYVRGDVGGGGRGRHMA